MKNLYENLTALFVVAVGVSIGLAYVFGVFYLIYLAAIAIAALPVVWSASLGGGALLLGVVKASIDIFASDSEKGVDARYFSGNSDSQWVPDSDSDLEVYDDHLQHVL